MKVESIAAMLEMQKRLESLDPDDASSIAHEFYRTFYRGPTPNGHVSFPPVEIRGQAEETRGQIVFGGTTGGRTARLRKPELQEKALEVLKFLNEKAGRNFRPVEENLRFIRARLDTCSVEDCKGVVARKTRVWKGTSQEVFLRPKTLFSATNFEQYIGEQGT